MEINHIFGFERMRDGGSLLVSFQSSDSCEYCVIFPINEYDIKHPKFKDPVLVNRTTRIEVDLTHIAAKQWLLRVMPLFNERQDRQQNYHDRENETEILNEMLTLCEENT